MAVKTKVKSKVKPKTKAKVAVKKTMTKPKVAQKKSAVTSGAKTKPIMKTEDSKAHVKVAESAPYAAKIVIKRTVAPLLERRRPIKKHVSRANQFNFMKAPGMEYAFEVGDTVEVFCDHEKNRDRIRGWVKGIVVQVDHKLAAVQFRSDVYLTDGWMVPDRILWFPLNSEHIRPVVGKKPTERKEFIPDY